MGTCSKNPCKTDEKLLSGEKQRENTEGSFEKKQLEPTISHDPILTFNDNGLHAYPPWCPKYRSRFGNPFEVYRALSFFFTPSEHTSTSSHFLSFESLLLTSSRTWDFPVTMLFQGETRHFRFSSGVAGLGLSALSTFRDPFLGA